VTELIGIKTLSSAHA